MGASSHLKLQSQTSSPVSPSQAASASPGPPSDTGTTWSPGLRLSPGRLELSQSELEQLLVRELIITKQELVSSHYLLDLDLSSSLPMYLPL